MLQLKGGYATSDSRLDRVPQFDERSRAYPIGAVVAPGLRSRVWRCDLRSDQGREGACVGHAWTHELAARPMPIRGLDNAYAYALYREAQLVDEWPGEHYSGTSVLAGAKVVIERKFIASYHWAFSTDEVLRAISQVGPVIFGIPWKDTMYEPRPDGLLDCSGQVIGGHAILGRGLRLESGLRGVGEPVVRLLNSWGRSYGLNGDAFIRVSDLEQLLGDSGECCLPIGRRRGR